MSSARWRQCALQSVIFLQTALLAISQTLQAQSRTTDRDEALAAYYWANPLTDWPADKLKTRIPALDGLDSLSPDPKQSPLAGILSRAGENVRQFRTNFANISCLETLEQERLKPNGSPHGHAVRRQFRYLILTGPNDSAALKEYRTDLLGREQPVADEKGRFVATSGFASLPIELSAERQRRYDYKYLGTETMEGRRTEVIAFAGHGEEGAISGEFVLAGKPIPLILQGIAWIDDASGQVTRMQTELLAPLAFAGLPRLSTSVTFDAVHFRTSSAVLWLPQVVDVTADFFGETYHNRHTYSDYQLFSVGTDQKARGGDPAPQ